MVDIIFSVLLIFCLILGIVGAVIPVIPGPIITWVGLLFLYFTSYTSITGKYFVIATVVILVITLLDFILPSFLAKKFGASKSGITGATIGMIAGMFFGIFGIVFGSFVGAFIGEIVQDKENLKKAFFSGLGAFSAFIMTTGLKLGMSIYFFVMAVKEVFSYIKNNFMA